MCLSLPFGNDALVGGKLAVDHPRDQHAIADLEEQVVLAALVADVAVAFAEQASEFAERLLRKNRLALVGVLLALAAVARHADQRQAMAVGRDQAHLLGLEHEQRAVEEIPRVLAGDRKLRLGDHFLHGVALERRGRRAARFRQRRKILARQRLHARVEAVGRDLHAALVLGDADVGFRQRLHDLVELLGRQRQRPGLRDRGRALTAQADFEIGGKKADLVAFGFHQHVRENRDRIFSLDDSLKKLQFSQ